MKKVIISSSLLLLFLLSMKSSIVLDRFKATGTMAQGVIDPGTEKRVMNATIHLILSPRRDDEPGGSPAGYQENGTTHERIVKRARGIGTVVTYRGRFLIVTHDHWEWQPHELARVQFRDAQDALLLEVSGGAFSRMIRYRDGGTMMLEAPGILLSAGIVPAPIGVGKRITPGSVVTLAYRSQELRREIGMQPAMVVSAEERSGRPILTLRRLDGRSLSRGDSGGGVWWNGEVVANVWTAVTVETTVKQTWFWGSRQTTQTSADTSVAARFPLDEQALDAILATNAPAESESEY